MKVWLVRAISFLMKEIHEIRRQPLVLLSLIGGPFLVLALFGATFRSTKPVLSTVLVWPENGLPGITRQQVEDAVRWNFKLVAVVTDPLEAMRMLDAGEVDVVQVLPQDIRSQIGAGKQPRIQVYSYAIDPTAEAWIRSMMLGQVNFINRQLLLEQTGQAQRQALTVQVEVGTAKEVLSQLEVNLSPERQKQAETAMLALRNTLDFFNRFLNMPVAEESELLPFTRDLQGQINLLLVEMDKLILAIQQGDILAQREQVERINSMLENLEGTIEIFVNLPPEVIVSPFQADYSNQRGQAYPLVIFFAPGVMALLIQHLAVTLGALAVVRERLNGAFEMFRIAPLNITHLLLGKTLAYCAYVLLTSAALGLLLTLMNVPVLGSLLELLALVVLMTLASVGIGMLISAISTSDSQAIQLTMLVLLMSIFFTGFFLPLNGFTSLAGPVTAVLPMSYGLKGLQSLMLVGRSPDPQVWLGLLAITGVTYGLVVLIMPRVYRKMMD